MTEKVAFRFGLSDGIRGERIVVVARRISATSVVNRSGRHKAQQVVARDTAEAWIEQAMSATRNTQGA